MSYMPSDWALLPIGAIIVVSLAYYLALRRRGYHHPTAILYALPIVLAGIAAIWLLGGFAVAP